MPVALKFAGEGKLGIKFGESGREWPIVSRIAPGSLAATHESAGVLRPGMSLVAVADYEGRVSVEGMDFAQGSGVLMSSTRPLELYFRCLPAPSEGIPPATADLLEKTHLLMERGSRLLQQKKQDLTAIAELEREKEQLRQWLHEEHLARQTVSDSDSD